MHSFALCSLVAVLFIVGFSTVAESSFSGFSEQYQYQRSTCAQLCEPNSGSSEYYGYDDGSSSYDNSDGYSKDLDLSSGGETSTTTASSASLPSQTVSGGSGYSSKPSGACVCSGSGSGSWESSGSYEGSGSSGEWGSYEGSGSSGEWGSYEGSGSSGEWGSYEGSGSSGEWGSYEGSGSSGEWGSYEGSGSSGEWGSYEGSGSSGEWGSYEGSGSYSGSSEGSGGSLVSCELTDSFYNTSMILTAKKLEIFVAWIKKIQTTILVDVSLTYEQMVVEIAYSLKAFFAENPDIEVAISYEWIGDWGYITDFIHVAYMINMEMTEEIITLDANDDCPLFDALRNATAEDSEKYVAVEELIVNFTIILGESSWTYAQQQAAIYQLWIAFFEVYESWESFFYSIEIEGYGLLEYYIDVTLIYQETTTLYTVVSGSTSSCVLLTSLQDAYENDSFSVSVRNEIKQLYKKFEAYFESNVEISVRLDYVMSECWSEYQLISYILPYLDQISCGDWGFFYEIIYSGCVCDIYGCGCLECGPGTEAPSTDAITVSSTTAEVTTTTTEVPSTTTTVLTTTTTEATTTIKPADCSTVLEVITVNSNNETIFLNNIISVTNNWSSSKKAGIQTYINLYRKQIYSSKTQKAIFSQCVTITNSYSKKNKKQHKKLMNIELVEWEGTVSNFCSCKSEVEAS